MYNLNILKHIAEVRDIDHLLQNKGDISQVVCKTDKTKTLRFIFPENNTYLV